MTKVHLDDRPPATTPQ